MIQERPLILHFLNVGHGDCTVIDFPSGRLSIVDINNSKALDNDSASELLEVERTSNPPLWFLKQGDWSEWIYLLKYLKTLTDPVVFLQTHFRGQNIFRFVATHPDMDHLSGLCRLRQEGFGILNFWDTPNSKQMTPQECLQGGDDYRDWQEYQRLKKVGGGNRCLDLSRGDKGNYWTDDGVSILSPTPSLIEAANAAKNWNLLSYVLRIQWGSSVIILGGDATEETWEDIYWNHADSFLKTNLLKASHHGRDTGYHQKAVAAMLPDFTIVSVGKKPENDASNKYYRYSRRVLSTRHHGDISVECWHNGTIVLFDSLGNKTVRSSDGTICSYDSQGELTGFDPSWAASITSFGRRPS